MRLGHLLVSLALALAAACEDPTLLIGARPIDEPDEQGPGAGATDDIVETAKPAPAPAPVPAPDPDAAEASLDAAMVPVRVADAGIDAQAPDEPERDDVPDFRPDDPPPPPRSRFAYRCRGDRECARVRGVCERGWCVQCRSLLDCPPFSMCSAERICVRQR